MLIFAQVSTFVHKAQLGLAYGLTDTLSSLAIILSPFLAGWLYIQKPEYVFVVAFGLLVISVLAGILFTPKAPSEPIGEVIADFMEK